MSEFIYSPLSGNFLLFLVKLNESGGIILSCYWHDNGVLVARYWRDPVIIPYKVMNRRIMTLYGIITGSLSGARLIFVSEVKC